MEQPLPGTGRPIFILSQARTGSTLVRYLVDTHPDVCCPPELALGRLCHALEYTIGLAPAAHPGDAETCAGGPSAVRAAVRSHIDEIMRGYCAAKKKARWCDKSTNNVEHLDLIAGVFPDAQYICLHRQCLDVVQSLLELFRYGFPGRYGQLVARSPGDLVDALIDSWIGPTRALLEFESSHAQQCVRVKYEDLVASPVAAAERLFAFLRLPFSPDMLDDMLSGPHDPGPGDFKIRFTSTILQNRVGRGGTIPRNQISDDRLDEMNALHAVFGYPPVGRQEDAAAERRIPAASGGGPRRGRPRWG